MTVAGNRVDIEYCVLYPTLGGLPSANGIVRVAVIRHATL